MKKKIAIMLTLILATGTFTACTAEEKMNNDIKTSVVSKAADVSVSEESSVETTEKATESTAAEKATVSKETVPRENNAESKEKSGVGQSSASVAATKPTQAVKAEKAESKAASKVRTETETIKATKKPTQKPTEKPKPTQPPTEKKSVDITSVVDSAIRYGKQLGMHYDSSLNTANASWFSPTNASYYDDTQSLKADCYADIEYVAYYYKSDGIKPNDLSFNVVAENNKIYVVYC